MFPLLIAATRSWDRVQGSDSEDQNRINFDVVNPDFKKLAFKREQTETYQVFLKKLVGFTKNFQFPANQQDKLRGIIVQDCKNGKILQPIFVPGLATIA
jgi:hypothetical protein